MICESCSATISDILQSHSIVPVLQKVDVVYGYSWYQCKLGKASKTQHCYCSEAHMVVNLSTCINSHFSESDLIKVSTDQVKLHDTVFSQNIVCKVCGVSLITVAYRFALTHATPVARLIDESHTDLGEWCCSLAHAQQSALNIVGGIHAKVSV